MDARLKTILPEFPSTPVIGADSILQDVAVEEKIDGANAGMMWLDGNAVIRNRTHVLVKGYTKKNTPAKIQFRSAWGWLYKNKKKFQKLNKMFNVPVAVYGEWCYALHGIVYDKLPDWFIVFDLLIPEGFLPVEVRHEVIKEVGLVNVPLLYKGEVTLDLIKELTNKPSQFSSVDLVEGVYIKSPEVRYKMIREGYIQGQKWSDKEIIKQTLQKS